MSSPSSSTAPATIADAWAELTRLHPVLAPGAASVRYARNGVYASADEGLEDGDEVAMIPPVSGGSDVPGAPCGIRARARICRRPPAGPHPRAQVGAVRFGHPRVARLPPRDAGRRGGRGLPRHHAYDARDAGARPGSRGGAARGPKRGGPGVRGARATRPAGVRRDRRRGSRAVRRRAPRDRPSHRRGAARRGIGRDRGLLGASGRGVRSGRVRDRRDEGPRPDLEGRAVRGRSRLDRCPGEGRPADRPA